MIACFAKPAAPLIFINLVTPIQLPLTFLSALIPHGKRCPQLVKATNITTICTTLSIHTLSRMLYNLRRTNPFSKNAHAIAPATAPPECSVWVSNPYQNNGTPGNNAAEGAANNSNPVVTINIADLQVI